MPANGSLLDIVQTAAGELGSTVPTSVVGNTTDDIATQMLVLAQAAGEQILSDHDWSVLLVEGATLTMVTGQQAYPLPADCDRLVLDTQWDRTNQWPTLGPDNPSTARWRRESTANQIGPRRALRQVGATITVWPVPLSSGDVIAYDYVSNTWAQNASTLALQNQLLLDTDVTLFRRRLMILALKWKWLQAKSMEAEAYEAEYRKELQRAIARDNGGGQRVNLGGTPRDIDEANADFVVAGPVAYLNPYTGA